MRARGTIPAYHNNPKGTGTEFVNGFWISSDLGYLVDGFSMGRSGHDATALPFPLRTRALRTIRPRTADHVSPTRRTAQGACCHLLDHHRIDRCTGAVDYLERCCGVQEGVLAILGAIRR